ncbi:Aldehyde dehydrogenase family 1 member A3 [Wickerhamiella sorbophila]|uniref:Aldehyde dehydrogenase family 1 member A3 n=1 Tax=Wickerhamiella sorbophila TaxID=45607 RepID=A0A2T0FH75_9ASCO|nr:Aldehyde dehydrogenase family 1 member A3 [Wickerhamiella sorbophila]PRT54289.1 Aldehyde dehydrogenase family 1 member A3 [Wickerhamiella sorbophila]
MLTTISPITNQPLIDTPEATIETAKAAIDAAATAQVSWVKLSLGERKQKVAKLLDVLEADADSLGKQITEQMGRPIQYTPGEVKTAAMRGRVMLGYADEALARRDVDLDARPAITKYLTKEPIGVALIIFPWNYPYLCLVNGLVPALLAGNTVIIKPSPQTPQVAEAVVSAAAKAGIPNAVISAIHTGDNKLVEQIIQNRSIGAVAFTGSVAGGLAVQKAAAGRTIPVALELGGNDAAYVRADADIDATAENVVDGALFNSGQSCCSIERVYVDEKIYDKFVDAAVKVVKGYKVGDPLSGKVQLGPMVSAASAARVSKDVEEAIKSGAKAHITPGLDLGPTYLYPQVLTDLSPQDRVLKTETFGPVLPIVKVSGDEEAIKLMNDDDFGLTASVWTSDCTRGDEIASQIEAGTVFVNRSDYPDPHLAWTGYKLSGRGVSLSPFGFDFWVKVKSHHVKTAA